jgi:hypothetical protein
MKFTIKNRFNDSVLFETEADSFRLAIEKAISEKRNLRSADLRSADLSSANLSSADLSSANLSYANLRSADLRYADLSSANLSSADLRSADLRSAKNAELILAQTSIVPDSGSFVGWKKCLENVIVKLSVPSESKRSNSTGRKCRAEFVDVIEVIGAEKGISQYDNNTEYIVGKRVTCDKWNENRFIECGGGIHFFITKIEAEKFQM